MRSDVEVRDLEGVALDEVAAWLDLVAHQGGEYLARLLGVADPDLEQGAGLGIEGRFPELLGVHLAEALVALHGQALAADLADRFDKAERAVDTMAAVLGLEGRRLEVGLAEGFAARIEAERFLAAQQAARSEEHTSELQSLMRISYAVFCL